MLALCTCNQVFIKTDSFFKFVPIIYTSTRVSVVMERRLWKPSDFADVWTGKTEFLQHNCLASGVDRPIVKNMGRKNIRFHKYLAVHVSSLSEWVKSAFDMRYVDR